jgi:N-acetylmuramoyl-L-alanine amidase
LDSDFFSGGGHGGRASGRQRSAPSMKVRGNRWAALVVACAVWLLAAAEVSATSWRIQRLGGRDYLPLSQVAGFYQMKLVPRGDRGVTLQSESRRMDFAKGSREARLDGVKHWLGFPVQYFAGQYYVSRMDLAKTIDPVMRPHRIPELQAVRTVVLDPGHGGHDRGAVNRFGAEKNFNFDVSKRVARYLREKGIRVVMTRDRDVFIPLEARPALAGRLDRANPGTIFVSIHFNAAAERTSPATGFEIFSLTPRGAPNSHDSYMTRRNFAAEPGHRHDHASHVLANTIHHAMLGRVPMFDRGVKRARFAVLRRATVPAVLVEGGFMSNPRDARLMADPEWRERLAESIARGIMEFVELTRTRKLPKLLARYRAEEQEALAGTDWEYQPLEGIGAVVRSGWSGARGWRGLLPAPLRLEMPPFRLEFEPAGWVQLEQWAASGEDARSAARGEQSFFARTREWPEPAAAWPGLRGWRAFLLPRGVEESFTLWPSPPGAPLAEGAAQGNGGAPGWSLEISGGAL